MNQSYDVVIVGAGAAGIGMALKLQHIPGLDFIVLEAGDIGESFRRWSRQTHFLTPSFHSNPYGLADLNAISELSSPAIFCGTQHPTGHQYADYLAFIADTARLPIEQHCPVEHVERCKPDGFKLQTIQGEVKTKFLIWATGEYQFPDLAPFPGADCCIHYATVNDWTDYDAETFIVIGGYESGVDASVNLVQKGHHVQLMVKKHSWESENLYDPSLSLSPHSRDRLNEALKTQRLDIHFGANISHVDQGEDSAFRVHAEDGRQWHVNHPPILATGFLSGGGAQQINALWEWDENDKLQLTEADESTRTPGLFLVGPQVKQGGQQYCFIYKFRQRFTQLASLIARCLTLDDTDLHAESAPWGPFGNSECCEDCEC